MNEPRHATRRTVLQTTAAALVGGSVLPGTSAGRGATGGVAPPRTDVEIVGTHDHDQHEHGFDLDTHEVGAGPTTLAFDNRTEHTHFAYLAKLPPAAINAASQAGADPLDYYVEHVTRPFQYVMDSQLPDKEPDPADLSDEYSNLEEGVIFPPWFGSVAPSGGPGLTTGQTTSRTTVDLAPGEYIVECYVKDDVGDFHSYHGMIDLLTVTDEPSGSKDPASTLDLSLSTDGIAFDGSVRPGQHTVAVHVEDQRVYDHLLGHDVHLLRLDDGTTIEAVNDWMNWMAPAGLVADGSEPATFLGGVQTILTPALLEGRGTETAYVHVTLRPGRHVWVSEVPDPAGKGLLAEFTVPRPGASRNWGPFDEHPDDDLSARAANSNMSDELKDAFDRLADGDEGGNGQ